MKRIAFVQALILLVLLGLSWFLIILKFKGGEESSPPLIPLPDQSEDKPLTDPSEDSIPLQQETGQVLPAPDGWKEWVDYLRGQPDADSRRHALDELRARLFDIPPEEAVAIIIEFLESGYDFPTMLRFQTGKDGKIIGATSFRAILLDWLSQLDPATAAQVAYKELNAVGTNLHPDVYVVHLRNYASASSFDSHYSFVLQKFEMLLNNEEWISKPTASIGEAMDIAVHLQDIRLVPQLSEIAHQDHNPNLRHAAKLALERLFELDSENASWALLQSETGMALDGQSRASLIARLDPATAETRELLAGYLLSPEVEASEFQLFIQYLPNLNISYSYNLLSPEKPITQSTHHVERLQHALDTLQAWQNDPRFSRYHEELTDRIGTLTVQLYGNPGP